MLEIRKLRGQLTNIVNAAFPGVGLFLDPQMKPPSERVQKQLWRIVLAAFGDQVRVGPVLVKNDFVDASMDFGDAQMILFHCNLYVVDCYGDDVLLRLALLACSASSIALVMASAVHVVGWIMMHICMLEPAPALSPVGSNTELIRLY